MESWVPGDDSLLFLLTCGHGLLAQGENVVASAVLSPAFETSSWKLNRTELPAQAHLSSA